MKKLFKNNIFLAFFFSLCLGALITVPNIIYGKGIYNLSADFSFQRIPFYMVMSDAVKDGSVLWTWFNELGSNFIGTFSFYNFFSPFNLILYMFPGSWAPYIIGWLDILKYGVAGLTAFLFLKRYVKNEKYALVGSVLYAFSGFYLTNMLFHFNDALALFPLLLYTLDNYMYDNKKGWFGLTVALLAFTNWFFLVGEAVFFILYFGIKLVCKEYKFELKKILNLVFEGVCGAGIAMVVLIPTALFIISNPRLSTNPSLIEQLKHPILTYVELLRAFILPAQTMSERAFLSQSNFTSVEAFLPFVGVLLALGCFLKYPKKWFSILIIVCGIFMINPLLNKTFVMFSGVYYARWLYMPILILALMSIKCLEDKCKLKVPLIINISLYGVLIIGILLYMWRVKTTDIIFDKTYLIMTIFIALMSLIGTYLLCNKMTIKKLKYLMICLFIFVTIWGNYMTYQYKDPMLEVNNNYDIYLNSSKELSLDNTRVICDESCYVNMGYTGKHNNVRAFNSNMNGTNFEFYYSIGFEREVSTLFEVRNNENDYLLDFLGVKYILSRTSEPIKNYEIEKETKNFYLFLNKDYKEFGFNVNKYITNEEFKKLSTEDKKKELNKSVVLSKEQIKRYKDLYNKKVKYNSNKFTFEKNGFTSKIDSTGETLAIYAIPYETGWKATNNGKEVLVEKVDNGMMAIKINKGINDIKFTYMTPGLKSGLIISIISFIIYCLYFYLNYRKKAK